MVGMIEGNLGIHTEASEVMKVLQTQNLRSTSSAYLNMILRRISLVTIRTFQALIDDPLSPGRLALERLYSLLSGSGPILAP